MAGHGGGWRKSRWLGGRPDEADWRGDVLADDVVGWVGGECVENVDIVDLNSLAGSARGAF